MAGTSWQTVLKHSCINRVCPINYTGHRENRWIILKMNIMIDNAPFPKVLSNIRTKDVTLRSDNISNTKILKFNRELAQMVERSLSMREVRGSVPRFSTFMPRHGIPGEPYLLLLLSEQCLQHIQIGVLGNISSGGH